MENNDKNEIKIIKWDVINLCGKEAVCNCLLTVKPKKDKKDKKDKKIQTTEQVCNKKAMFYKNDHFYCKTHAVKQTNYIIPSSQLSIKKINKMKLVELQQLCQKYNIQYPVGSKKEILLTNAIATMDHKFLDTVGTQSANGMNLIEIGIAIQKELDKIPLLLEVETIIIENQISPIANRMKTIQGMLAQYFIMNNKTKIVFISSANKLKAFTKPLVEGEEKATYSERKKSGILVTSNLLNNEINISFKDYFSKHKKKDDLADSFLQGVWYLSNTFEKSVAKP